MSTMSQKPTEDAVRVKVASSGIPFFLPHLQSIADPEVDQRSL